MNSEVVIIDVAYCVRECFRHDDCEAYAEPDLVAEMRRDYLKLDGERTTH